MKIEDRLSFAEEYKLYQDCTVRLLGSNFGFSNCGDASEIMIIGLLSIAMRINRTEEIHHWKQIMTGKDPSPSHYTYNTTIMT